MEFTYYPDAYLWKRTVNEEKKNRLRLGSGFTIDVPDFRETFLSFIKTKFPLYWEQLKDVQIQYHEGLVPYFENVFEEKDVLGKWKTYHCCILNGVWYDRGHIRFLYMDIMTTVLARESRFLHQRIQKMESIFSHIREKNEMLDSFIKTAEVVLKQKTRNAKKKASKKKKRQNLV